MTTRSINLADIPESSTVEFREAIKTPGVYRNAKGKVRLIVTRFGAEIGSDRLYDGALFVYDDGTVERLGDTTVADDEKFVRTNTTSVDITETITF